MAYRNIIIENAAKISARNNQLIIETEDRYSLPIEDINAVLLENRFTSISTHALGELAKSEVTVYVCDEKHLPCAVMTPFMQNVRSTEVYRSQLELTLPAKKRLWQAVVQAKINNQASCLDICGHLLGAYEIRALSKQVQSGDPQNVEATAASQYFKVLFGKDFIRDSDNITNAALNYGYAIMRGNMAKLVSVYGLIPLMGIHHNSTLNSFNLVDDLMEPFRPVVDLYVAQNIDGYTEMTPVLKRELFNLLNMDMLLDGYHYTVAYTMERMVQSVVKCLKNKSLEILTPTLLPLKLHSYE